MSTWSFNLKQLKTAQQLPAAPPPVDPAPAAPDPAMGADPSTGADPTQQPQKFTLGSLITYIDSNPESAMQFLDSMCAASKIRLQDGQMADSTSMFDSSHWSDAPPDEKATVAAKIFQSLPPNMIAEGQMGSQNNTVTAPQKSVHIQNTVAASNAAIHKLALKLAFKANVKAGFNLKTAAGLQTETYSLFDENSPSLDIGRTNQILTNRDVVERNRSWGLKPTDVFSRLGIDYDNLWQTFIMDRFYSEYQDKDGQWKGGYLDRRFETDKTDNTLNNYQLRPGEKRKPYLPEYGSTEARLETARGGKTFNWKEAKSSGFVKTADLKKKVVEAGPLDKCPVCNHSITNPHADLCYDCEKQQAMFPQHFQELYGEIPSRNPRPKTDAHDQAMIRQQNPRPFVMAAGATGLKGLQPIKAPGASKKQKKTQWTCPACQATNAGLAPKCAQCGAAKNGSPVMIQPAQMRAGDKPVGYVGQTMVAPTGMPLNQAGSFNSLRYVTADVPKHDSDDKPNDEPDDEEDEGGFEGHSELTEFNQVKKPMLQLSAQPANPLDEINRYHKQRATSFDALCGGPQQGAQL